jgi:hypothetical protein
MFMGRRIGGKFFVMSYAYILYPMPSLMLHTSTFLTVLVSNFIKLFTLITYECSE